MEISPQVKFFTTGGEYNLISFEVSSAQTHIVLWKGEVSKGNPPLVRIQSACMTSTALKGIICDCEKQMELSLKLINEEERGVFIYLDEEGRGHGLHQKVITMAKMNAGEDTVTAFTNRGLLPDIRNYSSVGIILRSIGVMQNVRLITNNLNKIQKLEDQGYTVIERVPAIITPTEFTNNYLSTKKEKLGHIL